MFGRPGKKTCGSSGSSRNDRFFDNREGIYRMGRVNSEVCDCQVIVYLDLIIYLTGKV